MICIQLRQINVGMVFAEGKVLKRCAKKFSKPVSVKGFDCMMGDENL
jgi:hypothetical protein